MNYMGYKILEPYLNKLGGGVGSDRPMTTEQIAGLNQEALGRGIVAGTNYTAGFAGKEPGVTWTSNAF